MIIDTNLTSSYYYNYQIGSFRGMNGWYTLQSQELGTFSLESGTHKFYVRKDNILPTANDEDENMLYSK